MEESVIQINGGITINANVSVEKVMYVKKNMFGILLQSQAIKKQKQILMKKSSL